jgi:hypothetical protein
VVKTLYAFAHVERLPFAFVMTVFILVAEELLWRGLLVDELRAFMPRALSEACSVLIYAFAQLGSGSFIVFALAVVCGSIWTAERRVTGSLLAPLIVASHLDPHGHPAVAGHLRACEAAAARDPGNRGLLTCRMSLIAKRQRGASPTIIRTRPPPR